MLLSQTEGGSRDHLLDQDNGQEKSASSEPNEFVVSCSSWVFACVNEQSRNTCGKRASQTERIALGDFPAQSCWRDLGMRFLVSHWSLLPILATWDNRSKRRLERISQAASTILLYYGQIFVTICAKFYWKSANYLWKSTPVIFRKYLALAQA